MGLKVLQRNLRILYGWIQWKLNWGIYCPRCGACGEGWINDNGSTGGCCPPSLCDHGFGCARYYDELEADASEKGQ